MAIDLLPLGLGLGGSLLGSLFGGGDGGVGDIMRENAIRYNSLMIPDLENFRFMPEDAQYSLISEDPVLKGRQEALINKLSELSDTGMSEADMAGYRMANQQANQAARQNSMALRDEARRRGAGGSGLEFAMREQANQDALTRGQNMGLQQAADSARQRALYNQAYGNMLSGVRNQDFNTKSANSDVINRFNAMNTAARNQATLGNLNRANEQNQQRYQNQLSKLQGQSSAAQGTANAAAANNAASSALTQNLIGMGTMGALAGAGYGPWAERKKIGEP